MFCKVDHFHPYGSYKDLKYFSNLHIEYGNKPNDIMILKVLDLYCSQLKIDENNTIKSLGRKWVPREKSEKFGWLAVLIAKYYYKEWFNETQSCIERQQANKKALTHYRKLISKINRELNTIQVNQCNGRWKDIDFNKDVTSITLSKQSKAFDLKNKDGTDRNDIFNFSFNKYNDRITCKNKYNVYLNECRNDNNKIKEACFNNRFC